MGIYSRKEACGKELNMEELRNAMLRYRAKHSISQGELARRCGLSLQTVNSVENGTQNPSRLTAEKIRLIIEEGKDD